MIQASTRAIQAFGSGAIVRLEGRLLHRGRRSSGHYGAGWTRNVVNLTRRDPHNRIGFLDPANDSFALDQYVQMHDNFLGTIGSGPGCDVQYGSEEWPDRWSLENTAFGSVIVFTHWPGWSFGNPDGFGKPDKIRIPFAVNFRKSAGTMPPHCASWVPLDDANFARLVIGAQANEPEYENGLFTRIANGNYAEFDSENSSDHDPETETYEILWLEVDAPDRAPENTSDVTIANLPSEQKVFVHGTVEFNFAIPLSDLYVNAGDDRYHIPRFSISWTHTLNIMFTTHPGPHLEDLVEYIYF